MVTEINNLRPVSEWIALVSNSNGPFAEKLREIYGDDEKLKREATDMCLRTLEAFGDKFSPERKVIIVRSTGRLNLLGTHIDHRGGSVNPIAIKQMWLVVEPRDDDLVLTKNVESERFADEQFHISQCLPAAGKIQNWDSWCHDEFEKRKDDPSITWSNYVRASALYFQHINTKEDGTFSPGLKGMNMMFYSDIPRAAGLSSSSALVMVVTEAVMKLNGLNIEPVKLIEHCGFAEWYVGTRGGNSDHAAITFGKFNAILHMTGFPMTVESLPLPKGYKIVLANSLVEAKKQAGARNIFNNRVAAYIFGLMMIRRNFPEYAGKLGHLRDVNPENLGVNDAGIFRILKSLPESANRQEVLELLSDNENEIQHVFRSHDEPKDGYKIRQVCLYGIAECIRADMVPQCLHDGDMKTFGQLVNASQDGDRRARWIDGRLIPIDKSYPDARLDKLIDDLESDDPRRAKEACLWRQSGGYDVSVPEMDMMVDIALSTNGVIGAGLVGAGMGGSVVVIVEDKMAQKVIDKMAEKYYRPRDLPIEAEIVSPIGGLCTIDV